MRRKGERGGRPSKLLQFSCCVGKHVEDAVLELSYSGKAGRRKKNVSLHRGGTARLIHVWKIGGEKNMLYYRPEAGVVAEDSSQGNASGLPQHSCCSAA